MTTWPASIPGAPALRAPVGVGALDPLAGVAPRGRLGRLEPAPAEPGAGASWGVGRALGAEAAAAALVAVAWFGLPLVADGRDARMALLVALALMVSAVAWRVSLATGGRERQGWRVLAGAALLAFVPVVGGASAALFGVGILLVAGDGWLRDRFRAVDAGIFAALVCGFVMTLALPGWDAVQTATPAQLVVVVTRAIGVAAVGATVLLVVSAVPRRQRPDVWLLAIGYLVPLITASAAIHGAGTVSVTTDWRIVSALAAVNGLVAMGLRLGHRGPVARALREGQVDGALVVSAGTAGFVALMAVAVLAQGAVPAGVVGLLIVIALLRHARTRIIAGDNQRLLQLALRSQAERVAQHRASLVALTAALEARDGYTGRHGEETVCLAVRVADALGLDGDERGEVDTVALLHDIGKIGTPNEVLHKPGPLTDEEWVVMREHPVIGERILRTVPGLESVARAVRHEHERWDGSGYPDGLAGEEIPLASRIVLVCDAYHAMTSDRPYRAAMAEEQALAELVCHAGTQFDPAVVDALVDVLGGDRAVAVAVA
jgi:Na+-translocating ferredoxin:NAD+ oxidoreductase RnfA subunit